MPRRRLPDPAATRGPVPPPTARSGNRRAGSGQFVEDPAGASTQTAKPQERARRRRGIPQGNAPGSDRRIPARRRRDRREDLPGGHRRGREGRCPYAGVPAQAGHRGYAARLSVSRQRPGHRLCSGRRGKLHIQSLGDVVPARIRAVFARYRIARPGVRGAHLGGCRVVRLRPRRGRLQAAVGQRETGRGNAEHLCARPRSAHRLPAASRLTQPAERFARCAEPVGRPPETPQDLA